MQTEKYLTAKQVADLERQLEDIEAWTTGLLDKCARIKSFLSNVTAGISKPSKGSPVLSAAQRTEILAKRRKRMLRKNQDRQ